MKRHLHSILFSLLLLLTLAANQAFCQASGEGEASFRQVDQLLSQGENQRAWQLLQEMPEETSNLEKLWRMARTQYEMGRIAESDQAALRYYHESEQLSRTVIVEYPEQSDGYKWLAIALGGQSKHVNTEPAFGCHERSRTA